MQVSPRRRLSFPLCGLFPREELLDKCQEGLRATSHATSSFFRRCSPTLDPDPLLARIGLSPLSRPGISAPCARASPSPCYDSGAWILARFGKYCPRKPYPVSSYVARYDNPPCFFVELLLRPFVEDGLPRQCGCTSRVPLQSRASVLRHAFPQSLAGYLLAVCRCWCDGCPPASLLPCLEIKISFPLQDFEVPRWGSREYARRYRGHRPVPSYDPQIICR